MLKRPAMRPGLSCAPKRHSQTAALPQANNITGVYAAGSALILYLRTINNQLTAAFNFAVKFYGLRENPCHKAGTMGKKNADEMLFWTKEEFQVFIEAMKDRPVGYTIFMIMYYTGLRVGELLALTSEDIDFDRHIISVISSASVSVTAMAESSIWSM